MFVIDFERGRDVEERLQRSGYHAMVPLLIEVDGKSIAEELHDKYIKVYIWPTLKSLIADMENYESKQSFKIPIDQAGIYVESDGQNVELCRYSPGPKQSPEWYGDRLTVPLQAFADEAITTAEDFVKYVLEVCPDYTEENIESARDLITDARTWYEQKYSEPI